MNKTIQALSDVIKENPLEEKLLFIPSYSIGHQVGEDLARSGTPWINLRVTTPSDYAQEIVSLELSAQGIRLIGPYERLIIVEKLYRDSAGSGRKDRYFEGAEEIPGILKCLARAIHEVRMAGLEDKNIDPRALIVKEKGKELTWLLKTYGSYLKENRLIDDADVLAMAIKKLEKDKIRQGVRKVLLLSDFPLEKLEKELVNLVGGKNLVVIPHDHPLETRLPKRLMPWSQTAREETGEPKKDIELLPWLFKPERCPRPFSDGSVSMFHALGESNEIREVFRRILKDGVPLDATEILVTTLEPYIALIYEIASAPEIPFTFSCGIPVAYTRPGRALMLYLRWQMEDFSSGSLIQLLSGGYFDFDHLGLGEPRTSPTGAASIIREALIGWGRDRYANRLKALAESYRSKALDKREEGEEEEASWAEEMAGKVDWVGRLVDEILATVPVPALEGTLNTRDLLKGALGFLNKFCRTASEMDGAAKSRLEDLLSSLIRAPSLVEESREAAKRLKEVVEEIWIGHSTPRPGHVHVSHFSSGGYTGRPMTYVVGLEQSKFPGALLQDPVLLDKERLRLGDGLVTSAELLHETTYLMAKVLSSLEGRVTLSYSCRDLRDDRELSPSSFLLSAYRVMSGEHGSDYRALLSFLGEPVGFIPKTEDVALNSFEWWLKKKGGHYKAESVHASYPNLGTGERAEMEREKEAFNQYDGWVPSASGQLNPSDQNRVLSSSRLESLAKCPYAFFIQHVLGVEPLEEMEKDPSRWLDLRQKGELLHEVFRKFMEELKKRKEKPNTKSHFDLIRGLALKEVEQWKKKVPPPNDLSFNREVEEIIQALRIFLRDEEERCRTVEPCFFELSFGIPGKKRSEISTEEPVRVKIKGNKAFNLSGRIDRVDRCGKSDYEVWDYKTGSSWGYTESGYLKQGKQLQHALYAIAAETLLRKKVDPKAKAACSGYFFPGVKGEGLRIRRGQPVKKEVYDALEDLFQLLQNGIFPASYDEDFCGLCDYSRICGGKDRAVRRTKERIENDDKLNPLKRLKEYA
jgi:RecB family exonuclease